jgi:hypothetical protein
LPESVAWFFKGFGNNFLDGLGHWMSRKKRVIRINQLSDSKVYAGYFVNKSTSAHFHFYGNYREYRKFS